MGIYTENEKKQARNAGRKAAKEPVIRQNGRSREHKRTREETMQDRRDRQNLPVWTTMHGENFVIREMSDSHIVNVIRYFLARMDKEHRIRMLAQIHRDAMALGILFANFNEHENEILEDEWHQEVQKAEFLDDLAFLRHFYTSFSNVVTEAKRRELRYPRTKAEALESYLEEVRTGWDSWSIPDIANILRNKARIKQVVEDFREEAFKLSCRSETGAMRIFQSRIAILLLLHKEECRVRANTPVNGRIRQILP